MTLQQDLKKAVVESPYVEMLVIDGSSISGTLLFRFTNSSDQPFTFGGTQFIPFPYQGTGWETTNGQPPRPKLTLSNVNNVVQPYLQQFQDLKKVKVMRIRTLAKYLDGQPSADSSQTLPVEVFYINSMTRMDKNSIEFELADALDLPNSKLPASQALKDDLGNNNLYAPGLSRVRFRG